MTSRPSRPRVVAVLPGLYASTIIGVAKPLMQLHATGAIDLELTFQFLVRPRHVERADVLVTCHSIDPAHAWFLDRARELRIPLVYEIDDNLLEPPPDVPGMQYLREPARQAALRHCVRQATLIRTYAPALKRHLQPMNPRIVLVDGPLDWSLVPFRRQEQGVARVQLVYATGRVQDSIGSMIAGPLQRVLATHANVDVTLWGPRLPGVSDHPRVRHRELIRDYDRFFQQFARAGFDIGLAPLHDDPFHRCKSNNKFREYAACRIAGVYSDTEVYRGSVVDGITGLLVPPHEDAWVGAISRLIEDVALRRRIQDEAERYARAHYGSARMGEQWLAHITEVWRSAPMPTEGPARGPSPAVSDRARVHAVHPLATATGIVRQTIRSAWRVPSLLRTSGAAGVWTRTRAQLAGFGQMMAWQFALWRAGRHR